MLNRRVLVLSSSYQAINICNVKRAVILLLSGRAHPVEQDPRACLRSPSYSMPVPEVIRIHRMVHIPYKEVAYCRRNVLLRDNRECQYCGRSVPDDELTLDHVVPLSRGGKDNWTNVVTACRTCNNHKGNFTPDEAGMTLKNPPKAPNSASFLHIVRHYGRHRTPWQKYLFY